ncbi:hypothetical protein L3Q82_018064 [Scortum barcoo]|uniref:Uncharacterized protein n=1 Tax=Scortum barcoo TaxID=214431 RepID=A0ACB8VIG2_9TELE|nr:hypothetical protein L3Q82_018064 [Scortum barcoo]
MSARNQEKGEGVDSDDDFQYEEVSLEGKWGLTEGEEDLEATVKAIKDRAEASAAVAATSPGAQRPEAVDDFLRSFLLQMGMTETLDCFQTEWAEAAQRGLPDAERVGAVPEVYIENRRLEGELKNLRRETAEYRRAAAAAAEALERVRRARDLNRLQHKRLVQERDRLVEEMRRLKTQCDSQEPAVRRLDQKYQAALKQTMLMTLEGGKASGKGTPGEPTPLLTDSPVHFTARDDLRAIPKRKENEREKAHASAHLVRAENKPASRPLISLLPLRPV